MKDSAIRPALYYPYIHVRSEDWLKGTLLCAPAVKRIVPEIYIPEDEPNIVRYAEINGPHGALLQTVPYYSEASHSAQKRLLSHLSENIDFVKMRFSRTRATGREEYLMHDAKFTHKLRDFLVSNELAWPSIPRHCIGRREWTGLHATLGSAVMTTLGLSIAEEQGYDMQ